MGKGTKLKLPKNPRLAIRAVRSLMASMLSDTDRFILTLARTLKNDSYQLEGMYARKCEEHADDPENCPDDVAPVQCRRIAVFAALLEIEKLELLAMVDPDDAEAQAKALALIHDLEERARTAAQRDDRVTQDPRVRLLMTRLAKLHAEMGE